MESSTAANEILSQLKQLTDGMASIRQDVDALKHGSTPQCNPSLEAGDGTLDKMAGDSPQLTS